MNNSSVRQIFAVLFISFVFLFSAGITIACSCIKSPTVDVAYQKTPNIVLLRAESIEKQPEGEKYLPGLEIKQTKLVVEKVFKGNLKVGQALNFSQGVCCICIWAFSEKDLSKQFLFYLPEKSDKDGLWHGSTCSRSGPANRAAADLLYLEKISKVRGRTRLSGIVDQSPESAVEDGDPDYKPLAGKTVRVTGMGKDLKLETDENGAFEIYGLPAGKYKITPEKIPGYKVRRDTMFFEVEIKAGGQTEADFTYVIDNRISGRLIDGNGRPYRDVCLKLISTTSKQLSPSYISGCTDKDGFFQIREVPTGTYAIMINSDGEITPAEPFGAFYYPNVAKIEDAAKITIGAGNNFSDLVITPADALETVLISGVVNFEKGRAPTAENYEYVTVEFVADEAENKTGIKGENLRTVVDTNGRFTLRVFKGQKGKLFAAMMVLEKEYVNCPKLDRLAREEKDRPGLTVKTNSIDVEGADEMAGVELSFPFPSCKKSND